MGKRTRYEPGTFTWVDLRTTDRAGAMRFYAGLFGWEYTDYDAGGGETYTAALLGGDAVAGLKPLSQEQGGQAAPPFWLSYVAVESSDAAAAQARELGGTVRTGPFDTEAGRMTVVADPADAVLALWESSEGMGACRVNDPGCLSWNELRTHDVPAAIAFYSALIGWSIEATDTDEGVSPYWTIPHAGAAGGRNGGVRDLGSELTGTSASWLPYFTVASLAQTLSRVTVSGGDMVGGPLDVPAGRVAIVRDPQGAVFGVFEGDVDA